MSAVKITASDVKKLRAQTGAGMMDCKKALKEAGGDFEKAIEVLRKKGQKVAAKRADREATEGAAIAKTNADSTTGVVVVIGCETDFVAKNDAFVAFATSIADLALAQMPADKEALLALDLNGSSVAENLTEQVGKIGEKIELAGYASLVDTAVTAYTHAGNKIGVLVGFNTNSAAIADAGRSVAMQVAAMSPVALDESSVPASVIEKELQIGREIAIKEGKPEKLIDRIAQGKLKKFFKDNTLVEQKFVKDSSMTVRQYVKSVDKDAVVTAFKRLAIG